MNEELDLRGIPCPENAAKAVLQIAMMSADEVLLVQVDQGEPYENVTRSIEIEGHVIEKREKEGDSWKLWVKVT